MKRHLSKISAFGVCFSHAIFTSFPLWIGDPVKSPLVVSS